MTEKEPVPISRGIEIQKNKVEEIRKEALKRYKDLTAVSKAVEDRLDTALSIPEGENFAELEELFEQKHVIEGIGREIEEIIFRSFQHEDTLLERWAALESRLHEVAPRISSSESMRRVKGVGLLNLEPFQETLNASMCGPASLKIVLRYYGIDKTEQELAELAGTGELGTDDVGIVNAAKTLGFEAAVKNGGSFGDIEGWLNKKVPVIVNWFTRGRSDYSDSKVADGHYSVVAGIDNEHIYLQDPELGALRTIGRDDFMKVWFDFTGKHIAANELVIRQLIAVFPKSDSEGGQV